MCVHDARKHDVLSDRLARGEAWPDCRRVVQGAQSSDRIVLELGGNIGACSLQLLYDTNATLIVFEPSPANLYYLTTSLQANHMTFGPGRVFVYPLAVGNTSMENLLVEAKRNAGDSVIGALPPNEGPFIRAQPAAQYMVHVRPLDAIFEKDMAKYSVQLMKMDVQGFECKALNGMKRLLRKRVIASIHTEVSLPHLRMQGCSPEMLNELMVAAGYTSFIPSQARRSWAYDVNVSLSNAKVVACSGGNPSCSRACTMAMCSRCTCAACRACSLPDPIVQPDLSTTPLVDALTMDTACLTRGECSLVCFTTTAKRVNATHHTLTSLSRQTARNRVAIVLPPEAELKPFFASLNTVVVRLRQDFGPASKLVGCLQAAEELQVPPNGHIAITDDDWIRGTGWLRAVEGASLATGEVSSLSRTGLPNGGYDNRVRGSYGYAATRDTFGPAESLLRFLTNAPAHCRYVDDVLITAYLRGMRHARVRSHPYPDHEWGRLMGNNPSWMANKAERLSAYGAARERDNRVCNTTLGEMLGLNPLEWIVSETQTSRRL